MAMYSVVTYTGHSEESAVAMDTGLTTQIRVVDTDSSGAPCYVISKCRDTEG